MKRIEIKKPNGIKRFLRDSAAVSPAIATLILIVIAAVAAAGVGILVTKTQENANSQTQNKDLSVTGTLKLAGASLLQEVSLGEVEALSKKYPGLTISVRAGTGNSGRAQLYNGQIDIAASAEIWPDTTSTKFVSPDPLTNLVYKGREFAVIQGGNPTATIYETKVGTGLIAPVAYIVNGTVRATTINIVPAGDPSAFTADKKTVNISFDALQAAYNGSAITTTDWSTDGTGKLTIGGTPIKLIQRGDTGSTHQKIFTEWLYGSGIKTLDNNIANSTLTGIVKKNSVPDIIAYINANQNTLGFIPWNPVASYATGNSVAAKLNSSGTYVAATDANKNIDGTYDKASQSYGTNKGLATDAYYYIEGVPTGGTKAFLDFVVSTEGQTILQNNGYFST